MKTHAFSNEHCPTSISAQPLNLRLKELTTWLVNLSPRILLFLDCSSYDITIVKLEGETPPGYSAIAFNNSIEVTEEIKRVTVSGYGKQEAVPGHTGDQFYGVLTQVELSRSFVYPNEGVLKLDQTTESSGAYNGDSGGSVFII